MGGATAWSCSEATEEVCELPRGREGGERAAEEDGTAEAETEAEADVGDDCMAKCAVGLGAETTW